MELSTKKKYLRKNWQIIFLISTLALPTIGLNIGLYVPLDYIVALSIVICNLDKTLNYKTIDIHDILFLIFILWCCISALINIFFVSFDEGNSIRISTLRPVFQLVKIILPFLLYRYVKSVLRSDEEYSVNKLFNFMLIMIVIYSSYQYFALTYDLPFSDLRIIKSKNVNIRYDVARIYGVFQEPSHYGHFLIMSIPVFFPFCIKKYRRVLKIPCWRLRLNRFILILLLATLILSLSRGAILSFVLGSSLFMYFMGREFIKGTFLTLVLVAIAGMIILCTKPEIIYSIVQKGELFINSLRIGADRASVGIMSNTRRAFETGVQSPLFGVGLGNFASIEGEINPVRGLLPRMFADAGVVGLTLFFGFLSSHLFPVFLRKYRCTEKIIYKYQVMGICLGLLQMIFFFNGGLYFIYFWFFLGMCASLLHRSSRSARIIKDREQWA
jgi:hypothetical protein